ncbi:MAG: type II secretion system protein M [Gammaproteobacteria bacterium]|nr:type II secretion system protein M [Gammaproteobacteria bacterium]MBQ0775761.1 type II secretion system protein M [Gammaproteobacteria bacterium]|tara:strand:+ start:66575 stop:67102 length:528 start_codon:yes stop_codon:yes gene_type:complete
MNSLFNQWRDAFTKSVQPAVVWYEGREDREKLVLQLLVTTLIALLLFSAVWMPAWQVRDNQVAQWQSQTKLLSWMQLNELQVRSRQQSGGKTSSAGDDWIAGLSRSASLSSVTIKSFNPEGSDSVRVQLENQAFSAAYSWLQALAESGIYVVSAEFLPGSDEGRVNLRASLSRQP